MTIDIGKAGACIVMVQNASMRGIGSLFLISWNSNTNSIIAQEELTKDTNPRRPANGSSSIVLSNLEVNNSYSIIGVFF